MKILGLSGSIRNNSTNRQLLTAAEAVLPAGATLDIFDGVGDLPLFNEDLEDSPPDSVAALREAIEHADAVLISTPEYNHSIAGPLKNALDWASRPHMASVLGDKPVVIVGASPSGFGAALAQAEARKVAGAIGAQVVDQELPVAHAFDAFGDDGRLRDRQLESRYREMLDELAQLVADASTRQAA